MKFATVPVKGSEGGLSMAFDERNHRAKFVLGGMVVGNPKGLGRKISAQYGGVSCNIEPIPQTLGATFTFEIEVADDEFAELVNNPAKYVAKVGDRITNFIKVLDRFAV